MPALLLLLFRKKKANSKKLETLESFKRHRCLVVAEWRHSRNDFSLNSPYHRLHLNFAFYATLCTPDLMCFIILLMQFNQNTVTRYEYKISLLLSVLLSFKSLENNIFWRMMKRERKKHHRRYLCCINMNGAWSMQKMKIFLLLWYEIVCYGDNNVLHG